MKYRKSFFILTFLSIVVCSLRAQNVSIQSSINKSEMMTGDQAIIQLRVRTNDIRHTTYGLSLPDDSLRFRVLKYLDVDTINVDNNIKEINAKVLITSFDSTLITIPPFRVATPTDTALSQALSLRVIQPKVDISKPNEIMPEKNFWTIRYTLRDIIQIILHSWVTYLFLGLVLLIIILWIVYKKRSRIKDLISNSKEIIPVYTAKEIALNAFEQLDKRHLIESHQYKLYYSERFDILRTYIEATIGWDVIEMTSEEIIHLFSSQKDYTSLLDEVIYIIQSGDLVKFAKYIPNEVDIKQFKEKTLSFIDKSDKLINTLNEIKAESEVVS